MSRPNVSTNPRMIVDPRVVPHGDSFATPTEFAYESNFGDMTGEDRGNLLTVASQAMKEIGSLMEQEEKAKQEFRDYQRRVVKLGEPLYGIIATCLKLLMLSKVQTGDYPDGTVPVLPATYAPGSESTEQVLARMKKISTYVTHVSNGSCRILSVDELNNMTNTEEKKEVMISAEQLRDVEMQMDAQRAEFQSPNPKRIRKRSMEAPPAPKRKRKPSRWDRKSKHQAKKCAVHGVKKPTHGPDVSCSSVECNVCGN